MSAQPTSGSGRRGPQIDEADAALKRVDDGTYGIDEETGEPINPDRLKVVPAAPTNVS